MDSTLSGRSRRSGRRRPLFPRMPLFAAACIILASALFVRELIQFSQQEDRIPNGVAIGSVPVGGMTESEARAALEAAYAQPITLYYRDSPIVLEPAEIGWRLNVPSMLASAAQVGEEEGSFWRRFVNYLTQQQVEQSANLPLLADYQTSLLDQVLQDIARRYDQEIGIASYDVSTLTTFTGETTSVLDVETALSLVDDALRQPTGRVVALPVSGAVDGRPELNALRSLIIDYLDSNGFIFDGQTTVAAVFIMDLVNGEEISILGDVAFSAASTIKVPVLIDYFRRLDREPNQDEAFVMANSLLCSENSSTNLLLEIIGGGDIYTGLARVNETIQYLGAINTYLSAPMTVPGQEPGSIAPPATAPNTEFNTDPDPFNQTTAEDIGTLFSMLYDCAEYGSGALVAYPDGQFTQRECRQMLELMSANDLQRLLQGGIPEGVRISHKNGWLNTSALVGDAGIVYPENGNNYIIAVYLWEQTAPEEATSVGFGQLWPLLEGISRATWNHFNPDEALTAPRTLPQFAQDCEEHGYLPPYGQVNLDDINAWRR